MLRCMTSCRLTFRTCIGLRAGFVAKKKKKKSFRPHTVYVSLRRVKPSKWSCAAPFKYIDRRDSALFRCSGLCHEK